MQYTYSLFFFFDLYTPTPFTTALHVQTFNKAQFDLWHFRLGHIPHDKLLVIHQKSPFVQSSFDHKECDICYFAKQKHPAYHLSDPKSSHVFQLSHADIWGPVVVPSIQGHKYFLTLVDDFTGHT